MAWGAIAGAAVSLIGGSLLGGSDKSGQQAQNNANEAGNKLADTSSAQWDFYKQNYQPVEAAVAKDALNAGSAAEYERASEQAQGDSATAFANAKAAAARDAASYGLNPGDGRFQAQQIGLDLAGAANEAGAQNRARQAVADMAWKKRLGVAQLGQGTERAALAGLSDAARVNAGLAADANQRDQQAASGLGNIASGVVNGVNKLTSGGSTFTGDTIGPNGYNPQPE